MGLVERKIEVEFVLGKDKPSDPQRVFKDSGGKDTMTLSNLRMRASILKAGFPSLGTLDLQIYGMTSSQMNQLGTYGFTPSLTGPNFVRVKAGDDQSGLSTVFYGTIKNAWVDTGRPADFAFRVDSSGGLLELVTDHKPTSYQGAVDAAFMLAQLADDAQLGFENNGISVNLINPYYEGSALQQIKDMIHDADINGSYDDGVLAIWPKGGARGAAPKAIVTPRTGLVGFPSFASKGIIIRTLFNKLIRHGATINVAQSGPPGQPAPTPPRSELNTGGLFTPADGDWVVFRLDHDLDAQVPNGKWFSTLYCHRTGEAVA